MHMKTRITLTIDPEVSYRAKELACKQGISFSAMVEKMLAEVSGIPKEGPALSFSQRWRGKMEVKTLEDTRGERLRDKYNLED